MIERTRRQTKAAQLRALVTSSELQFLMEAHSGLSAKVAEEAGFAGIWASGLSMSAMLGVRDANEASWTQVLDIVEFMNDATGLPILLDGDTGYGNFNSVRRLVRKLEQRDVAGVCLEDKMFPKTNSFLGGSQELVPVEEFCGKIQAAKDTQGDPDFVVVARVEAFIAGYGLAEAMRRAEAYHAAGADAILMHSARSNASEILAFTQAWGDRLPVVIVPTKVPPDTDPGVSRRRHCRGHLRQPPDARLARLNAEDRSAVVSRSVPGQRRARGGAAGGGVPPAGRRRARVCRASLPAGTSRGHAGAGCRVVGLSAGIVMISSTFFLTALTRHGYRLFTGVPCSYLKPFINQVIDNDALQYVPAANEGDAVAIASGAELGAMPSVVMFQNSGLGNAVSPLTSLNAIFQIPVLLIVTWRGEPGGKPDEPQHALMGAITTQMLDLVGVRWEMFPTADEEVEPALERAVAHMTSTRLPYAFVMREGSVAPHALASNQRFCCHRSPVTAARGIGRPNCRRVRKRSA